MPEPTRMIYFPKVGEHRKEPHIIFVLPFPDGQPAWDNCFRGTPYLEEIGQGRFALYSAARCQPYTDELWNEIQNLLCARKDIEQKFDCLMRKGQRALTNPPTRHSLSPELSQ